ncbi:MAG: ABC transporter permease [bacterium]|nr:ABC transporter permease [bacterium]
MRNEAIAAVAPQMSLDIREQHEATARSMWVITMRRLRRSKTAMVGLTIVLLLFLVAALADVLSPFSPTQTTPNSLSVPTWLNLMGTDLLGRDVLSRVMHGSRVSVEVGVVSILLALFIGLPLGLMAGFYGGLMDQIIMRCMDVILAFPIILLAIVIRVILEPSTWNVVLALGIVRIPILARLVRSSVLSVKENEYIEAVKALALSQVRVLGRHVLPNCLAPIIVISTLNVGNAIIIEATLSFLGLGTQPPTPTWGWDLKQNLTLIEINPWITIFPGLAILVAVLAFNLLGDGLRDALDPRLKA